MPLHIFLGDEVFLYFIMWVEVVEIQIWFGFKLLCSLQKGFKNYRGFSNFLGHIGSNPGPGPAGLLPRVDHLAQLPTTGGPPSYRAHRAPVAQPDPFSLIRPNSTLTRPESEFIPVKVILLNRIYPLLDSSISIVIWSRLANRIGRTLSPLRVVTKSPIYGACSTMNLDLQIVKP
jgi:hypothetical protein